MKKSYFYFAAGLIVLALGFVGFYWGRSLNPQAESHPSAQEVESKESLARESQRAANEKSSAETAKGSGASEDQASLPKLDESDGPIEASLTDLISKERLEALFNVKDLVRKLVVTIDNLTENRIPNKLSVFKPLEGDFLVEKKGEAYVIDPKNFDRYSTYVTLLANVDVARLIAVYKKNYPLFQEAYHELGTDDDFNERLITVIDQLVATPSEKEPLKLEQLGYYEFADPELESYSIGQKILLRMGNPQADQVKSKLKLVRRELSHLKMK